MPQPGACPVPQPGACRAPRSSVARVVSCRAAMRVTSSVARATESCACGQSCHARCARGLPAVLLGHDPKNLVATCLSRDQKNQFSSTILNCSFSPEHFHRKSQDFKTNHQGHSRPWGTKTVPLDSLKARNKNRVGEISYLLEFVKTSRFRSLLEALITGINFVSCFNER